MRFNPKARLDTSRVGDDGGRGGPGGGGMRLPIPGGTTAGGGIGGLLVLLLLFVLFQCMGGLPGQPSGQDQGTQSGNDTSRVSDPDRYANCKTGADAQQDVDCARIAVENSLYNFWKTDFEGDNAQFQPAKMQTFSGAVNTACGQATSQVGPFYCPGDQTIYLDTTFFDQVLEQQLGGPDGGFVEPYVIGHEYGHHIQNLAGIMNKVRTQKGPIPTRSNSNSRPTASRAPGPPVPPRPRMPPARSRSSPRSPSRTSRRPSRPPRPSVTTGSRRRPRAGSRRRTGPTARPSSGWNPSTSASSRVSTPACPSVPDSTTSQQRFDLRAEALQ